MEQRELTLAPESVGLRLDRWLAEQCPDLSRSQLQNLIEAGSVTCNGSPLNKKDKLKAGQTILLTLPDPQPIEAQPQNIPLDIVYEDDSLLVVNKPKGMVVHPAPGNPDGTMVNALLWHCAGRLSGIGGAIRPGIVHRIDKDTSGLVLAAKHAYAAPLLARNVETRYDAIAEGELPLGEGVIDAPIGRQAESIIGRCVTPEGKPSRTEYTILEADHGLSLAACVPVTGRTHQIRVHFASIGHPLAGDDLYGGRRDRIGRQALHCAKQTFRVPEYTEVPDGICIRTPVSAGTGRTVTVESPLPQDMADLLS